jgi:membrane protease YdiL (CAAX protease family)
MDEERKLSNEIKSIFDKKGKIVLFSSILLTIAFWFLAMWYTNKSGYTKDLVVFYGIFGPIFNNHPILDFWQYIFQFWITMLLFFFIPLIIVKYYFKESFRDYGLRAGKKKIAVILTIPFIFVFFIVAIFTSQQPSMVAEYPLSKLIGMGWALFVFYEMMYFFYFFAIEVMMRGYIQWGLMRENTKIKGIIIIIAIQTTISTLFHIGKPMMEITAALALGPVLGYVAIKIDSIWYGMFLHFILNIFMDFLILFWLGMLPTHL